MAINIGYNSINLRLDYSTLEIHSPKEIVNNVCIF